MAIIRVINNHTGDKGAVDESWLTRWPDDFTALGDDHAPLAVQAAAAEANPGYPIPVDPPSDGTPEKEF